MKGLTAASISSDVSLPKSLTALFPHPIYHRVFENNHCLHTFLFLFLPLDEYLPSIHYRWYTFPGKAGSDRLESSLKELPP